MSKPTTLSRAEVEKLDTLYREGGLLKMASLQVHYDDLICPHEGCGHSMDWIDFKLELHGDPEGVYKPLVQSWWKGEGFLGECPNCGGIVRFQTIGMTLTDEGQSGPLPHVPSNWAEIAQFA